MAHPKAAEIIKSLNEHINLKAAEDLGGKFEVTDDHLIARFPSTLTIKEAAEAACALTTLSKDASVVTPGVSSDPQTGELVFTLDLEDVPPVAVDDEDEQ